jgi:hypothetical protein
LGELRTKINRQVADPNMPEMSATFTLAKVAWRNESRPTSSPQGKVTVTLTKLDVKLVEIVADD